MKAKLVFLGRLEDMAGRAETEIAVGVPLDWGEVLGWLGQHCSPDLAGTIDSEKVRVALNGALVTDKRGVILADGDEMAFLPPVSGG